MTLRRRPPRRVRAAGRAPCRSLRAGADVALLVSAAVAYWQLDRQTSGTETATATAGAAADSGPGPGPARTPGRWASIRCSW
ncbi:hypothetical protein ID867_13060 [Streptomyces parvulus]|nr:hypothetical protein [Streptomyces parvulus]